jgi:hypothetical protein
MERLGYALLTLIPIILRLVNLGQRSLAPAEASAALRAWQQAQGMHPALDAGQPLLFTLQSLTFFVTGATDATARIWPLLAAAALPLALYGARGWLGRWTALIAATLITLSPLINAFARRGDGVSFALLAAGVALAGWARMQEGKAHGWLWTLAGLALALISGPAGFTVILALGLLFALTYASLPRPTAPAAGDWGVAAAILFLGGTAFFVRFDALGLMAVNLTQWLHNFTLAPRALLTGMVRLAADEPLLSLFGTFAVTWGLLQGGKIRAWSLAAALAALIAIAQGPDVAYSRAAAAFFLALPTAAWLVHLARQDAFHIHSLEETLFIIVLILLAFLSAYALISFAQSGNFNHLTLFFVTLAMGIIVTGVFIMFIGWREVQGGLLIAWLILTLLFGAGMIWQLAFNATLPTLARVYPTEALPDARDLVRTYGDISQHITGDRWAEEIVLIPGSPSDDLIQWRLRRSQQFSVAAGIDPQSPPPIIIAPAEKTLSMGDEYAGQAFAPISNWGVDHLATTNDAIHWFFFRRAPFPPPPADTINLWVRLDLLSLDQPTN